MLWISSDSSSDLSRERFLFNCLLTVRIVSHCHPTLAYSFFRRTISLESGFDLEDEMVDSVRKVKELRKDQGLVGIPVQKSPASHRNFAHDDENLLVGNIKVPGLVRGAKLLKGIEPEVSDGRNVVLYHLTDSPPRDPDIHLVSANRHLEHSMKPTSDGFDPFGRVRLAEFVAGKRNQTEETRVTTVENWYTVSNGEVKSREATDVGMVRKVDVMFHRIVLLVIYETCLLILGIRAIFRKVRS